MKRFYGPQKTLLRRGFSIIELMVTIAIMAVMSGILLAYNRSTDSQLALSVGGARIVGFLNRAKSFALEKRDLSSGSAPACAYGVSFKGTPTRMVLFSDYPMSGASCTDQVTKLPNFNGTYDGSVNETVETLPLDARLVFVGSPQDIAFVPPYLSTLIGGSAPAGPVQVQLAIAGDSTKTITVEIGPGGDITQL